MIADMTSRFGVGCVRVSTDRQERSIDEQKEAIRAAATRDGVTLLEKGTWCADEGISGSILDRPGLQKLLALCRTRDDITDIYFWKRNRLARTVDPLDGMTLEREIEKTGKCVHFVQGIQKTGNRMLDTIAGALEYAEAGQYLVNLSADTARGLIPLTKRGFDAGRPTPYGYDRLVVDRNGKPLYTVRNLGTGTRHQIFPNGQTQIYENGTRPQKDDSAHSKLVPGADDRVSVIRRIFESSVYEEKGIRTIVEELNAEGIPSPRGKQWSIGTIRSILVNPVYYGANVWNVRSFSKYHRIESGKIRKIDEAEKQGIHYHGRPNWVIADEEHRFEGIISEELFNMAQAKRTQRNKPFLRGKSITSRYVLSGLAVCTCGHNLQGHTKTSGKKKGRKKYPYYACGGFYMKGKTVCERYLLPRDALEKPIFDALSRRLKNLGQVDYLRARIEEVLGNDDGAPDADVERYRTKIAGIDERTLQWEAAIEKGLNMDMAVAKLNALAEEKQILDRKLRGARARKNEGLDRDALTARIAASLDNLDEVLAQGTVAEVKAVLGAYIGRIEVDPFNKKARIGFLKLPIRALLSDLATQTARISMVAGAGLDTDSFTFEAWEAVGIAA